MAIGYAKYAEPDIDAVTWVKGQKVTIAATANRTTTTHCAFTAPNCLHLEEARVTGASTADFALELIRDTAVVGTSTADSTFDFKTIIPITGKVEVIGKPQTFEFNPPIVCESSIEARIRNLTDTASMYVHLEGWESPKR